MRTFASLIILAAAASLTVSSCAKRQMVVECKFPSQPAPIGPALVAQEYGSISPIPLDAVQYTDYTLTKQVVVQTLMARRTQTNTVQVYARMINCSGQPVVVGTRTTFMDATQFPTEPQSAWKNVFIQPFATADYNESSTSVNVANYLVELRDASHAYEIGSQTDL